MKKLIGTILVLTFVFGVIGCENNSSKKYMEEGKTQLENKQYEKALESFKLYIEKDNKNQEIILLSEIIEGYLKSKEYVEKNDFETAKETLDNIDKEYEKYSIKDDINLLKNEVNNKISQKEETNKDNKSKVSEVDKNKNSESQKSTKEINKNNKSQKVENKKSQENKKNTEVTKKKSFSEDQAKEIAMSKYGTNSDIEYIVTESGIEDGKKYHNIIVKSISIAKNGGSGTIDVIKVFENGTID